MHPLVQELRVLFFTHFSSPAVTRQYEWKLTAGLTGGAGLMFQDFNNVSLP